MVEGCEQAGAAPARHAMSLRGCCSVLGAHLGEGSVVVGQAVGYLACAGRRECIQVASARVGSAALGFGADPEGRAP